MKALNGTEYKGRTVRCNDADEEGHGRGSRGGRDAEGRSGRGGRSAEKGSRGRRGSDVLVLSVEVVEAVAQRRAVVERKHAVRRKLATGVSSSRTMTM